MGQVVEKSDLEILEASFLAAQTEIRDLNLSALRAMKSLNDKTGKTDFDVERYRDLKKKLQTRLPLLETKLRRERIRVLQERRVELQKDLAEIEPAQRETKRLVIEAQKLLDEAWQRHAKLDLKAASIESQLAIGFEELRANQRSLQDLIGELTGLNEDLDHDDRLSAIQDNYLIRN
jgi:chromosome segregation ATPase